MIKLTKAVRYTALFAVVGIIVTFSVAFIETSILNTYNRSLPFISLSDHVKNRSVEAHLWFEELLAGDHSIRYESDVLGRLKSSLELLRSAYDGSETEIGHFQEPEEETKVLLKQAMVALENLIIVTEQRWSANQREDSADLGNAGGGLDTAFDERFQNLQSSLDRLSNHIRADVQSDADQLSTLAWVSIGLVGGSLFFLTTLLFKLQHGNDRLERENEKKLQNETHRIAALSSFIEAVSSGDYTIELEQQGEDDNLTPTLVAMRDKLKRTAEDDRKRSWSTTGVAQIGDILRNSNLSASELYDNIIRFVVKYTRSNQGGLFLLSEDTDQKKALELVACYAFERKKYLRRTIEIGDGLVGQCYLEGERIYLLEVPEGYISITSGLGGTAPNAVLIVPLKVNDKIYGVLELASFNRYENHEIELVEKFAESIASTISAVRVNETTRTLLEQTQQQAEEMKSQEEEIRQNMEELEATQEEMRRKQTILEQELEQSREQSELLRQQERKLLDSQDTLQAIVDHIPRAIFWKDKSLRFMGCNKLFASIAGASAPTELIGKSDYDMAWSAQADAYRKDDAEVMSSRKSKLDIEEVNVNSSGEKSWVLTSKVPIINHQDEVVAILGMFEDITTRKRLEADVSQKLHEREQALKELNALKQLLGTGKP